MKIIIIAIIIVVSGAVGSGGVIAWAHASAAFDQRVSSVRNAALANGFVG